MGNAALTWFGTNSFLLDSGEAAVLVDPFVQLPGAENPNSIDTFIDAAQAAAGGKGTREVLVTHNHFDHIGSIRQLMEFYPSIVYCTECGVRALGEHGCPTENVVCIGPGSEFDIGDMHVKVLQGRHIEFDGRLVAKTLSPANMLSAWRNVPALVKLINAYDESGETVVYDITVGSEDPLRIMFMGSLSLDDATEYPTGADYLALPYQGSSYLPEIARDVIGRLEPKRIIASHFDNAFPPVSQTVDTSSLVELVEREFPDIKIVIPAVGDTDRL